MFDRPTCGDQFDTKRGRAVHLSSVHGSQLPNRTCENCESAFHSSYQKKYCSEECLDEAVSYEGSSNPNYRGGKETTDCELCGESFEYDPSDKRGRFCPDCVESEQWRTPPSFDGERNPRWNGGTVELECQRCGQPVERYPSNVNDVVVCGDECRGAWLAESFDGEGHPNWAGGGTGPYGEGWNAVREAALERDEYACVRCDTGPGKLGRNPDVHHIVPVRLYVESGDHEKTEAHCLENVVTLCPPCHRRADVGTIDRETLRNEIGASAPREMPNAGRPES